MATMVMMETNFNELYHHGVKGMKWGVRRSKEQLGYKRIRKRQRESSNFRKNKKKTKTKAFRDKEKTQKRREEILKSPSKLYKHRNEFTKQEIDDAIRRYEWERRLSDFSTYELNAGKRYVDTMLGYADTGIKAYNTAAKVYNTVNRSGKRLPLVGGNESKKKKDQDD